MLKLWLCEPLYLPALRATGDRPPEGRLPKKACVVPLQLPARIVRDPSVRRSLTAPLSGEPRREKRSRIKSGMTMWG